MSILDHMEIIDISPLIHPGIAVFPGDTPFSHEFLMDMKKGDHLTLSSIKSTVHLGAHTDAPNHYAKEGTGIAERPLHLYIGQAQVIEVKGLRNERIRLKDFDINSIQAPRVLFKTGTFPNPDIWNSDFMALSAEVIEALASRGVRLVGIDTPSIDPAEDKDLESHQAVAKNDMAILEGIVLEKVSAGIYQLIALPLPIKNADATPVRAILLK